MHGLTVALGVWAVIAPLAGIVLGHYLTRSWQREQWLRDSRKQEFRELLTALTRAYQCMSFLKLPANLLNQEHHDRILSTLEEANITFNDRIYISEDLREKKLYDLWLAARTQYEKDHDWNKFLAVHQQIRNEIVKAATREQPTIIRRFMNWVDSEDVYGGH
jgi:hypothetical protein